MNDTYKTGQIKNNTEELLNHFKLIFNEETYFNNFVTSVYDIYKDIPKGSSPNFRNLNILSKMYQKILNENKEMLFSILSFFIFLNRKHSEEDTSKSKIHSRERKNKSKERKFHSNEKSREKKNNLRESKLHSNEKNRKLNSNEDNTYISTTNHGQKINKYREEHIRKYSFEKESILLSEKREREINQDVLNYFDNKFDNNKKYEHEEESLTVISVKDDIEIRNIEKEFIFFKSGCSTKIHFLKSCIFNGDSNDKIKVRLEELIKKNFSRYITINNTNFYFKTTKVRSEKIFIRYEKLNNRYILFKYNKE